MHNFTIVTVTTDSYTHDHPQHVTSIKFRTKHAAQIASQLFEKRGIDWFMIDESDEP